MEKQNNTLPDNTVYFFDLLVLLRQVARAQLGLFTDPNTGEIHKNVQAAQHIVSMLEALQEKTHNSLTEDEKKVLTNLLTELRLACVKASEKEDEKTKDDIQDKNNED